MSWRKIWRFVWKDDSFASWVVNVILAIIIVKFLIYPGLGLLLGTEFPVVAVVSCSMEHKLTNCWPDCYMKSPGRFMDLKACWNREESLCGLKEKKDYWSLCGKWYEDKDINEEQFKGFNQANGFYVGDIFVLIKPKNIKIGDIIVYNNGISHDPIIHRVVKINELNGKKVYSTKGDYNANMYGFEEKIDEERVYGKVLLKAPYLGWVKVMFNMILKGAGII